LVEPVLQYIEGLDSKDQIKLTNFFADELTEVLSKLIDMNDTDAIARLAALPDIKTWIDENKLHKDVNINGTTFGLSTSTLKPEIAEAFSGQAPAYNTNFLLMKTNNSSHLAGLSNSADGNELKNDDAFKNGDGAVKKKKPFSCFVR
jgi:hypothetical protein